jgi:P-type conjugative transfer ATPase TrbB
MCNETYTEDEQEIFTYLSDSYVDILSRDDLTDLFINEETVFAKTHTEQFEIEKMQGNLTVVINEMAHHNKTVVNQKEPILECMFAGFRVTATIFPVTKKPTIVFRKPNIHVIKLAQYVEKKQLTQKQYDYVIEAIGIHKNIVIVGSTGSGKTTFANAMIDKMTELSSPAERIVILEDTDEIQCKMRNKTKLFTSHNIDMDRLLKTSLRLNPERILVGEVRDKAALSMLKSWNTGHPGGITTIHANGCEEALQRLIDCAMEAGVPAPYSLVRHTINTIIFIKSKKTEKGFFRYVEDIAEVVDFDRTKQKFILNHIGD